ncbi:LOW QUALITY PROTEIN: Ribonuclease H-like domain containing protein [Parasponia andersonii]|uniref:Ribonuclease H-like domain containing protein n=1 Tax=Parasponia andersonii TaxID=3476 RepID=A0A2P5A864_PARAD|nr:LOW QUALITY PROTEIN: Ribonuclease H-like domain containing protein [Parasponia andersonii]
MASTPFDLMHYHIWGPYHVSSHSGHQYFVTLIDDYSRFTWIFLLKDKSDVASTIPKFFNMVTTQFNVCIKSFRSDNVRELYFTQFFNEKSTTSILLCGPKQNFMVVRKHQHLLNVARQCTFILGFPFLYDLNVFSLPFFLLIEHHLRCCTTRLHIIFGTSLL